MLLKKMKASLAVALVMSMSLLTACGGSAEKKADTTEKSGETQAAKEGNAAEGGTIKLGVLAPLTGTNAEYGKGFQIAMQMAVDKINADGGVKGKKFELSVKDSKGDQKESSDLARQFADDDEIMAILGDFTSGCCMANASIVD